MSYTPPGAQRPSLVAVGSLSQESLGIEMRSLGLANAASATWPLTNLALFIPISLAQPYTALQLYSFNGATASGNIDLGIYDEAGNRLVSKGSTAQAGTNAHQFLDTTDTTLNGPGRYYFAVAMDNTTGTLFSCLPPNIWNARACGICEMTSAFPLPNPATMVTTTRTYCPVIGMLAEITS